MLTKFLKYMFPYLDKREKPRERHIHAFDNIRQLQIFVPPVHKKIKKIKQVKNTILKTEHKL